MADPYAELIGDPVAHSLSPALHRHWLTALGLAGTYRVIRCPATALPAYLDARLRDPAWRGCNVTMPLKQAVRRHLDHLDASAAVTGAVNCVVPRDGALYGHNSDPDGVAAALGGCDLTGRTAIILGAGGGARAAAVALDRLGARPLVLARDPRAAADVAALAAHGGSGPLAALGAEIGDAAALLNATPLGMADGPPLPAAILGALRAARPGTIVLDMVYRPLETPLLAAARTAGLTPIDGFAMLIGQARRAFALFFGAEPPPDEISPRAALPAD